MPAFLMLANYQLMLLFKKINKQNENVKTARKEKHRMLSVFLCNSNLWEPKTVRLRFTQGFAKEDPCLPRIKEVYFCNILLGFVFFLNWICRFLEVKLHPFLLFLSLG